MTGILIEKIGKRRGLSETAVGYIALVLRILFIAAVGAALFTKVFLVTQVTGNEMFPALKDGDLILAFRLQRNYAKNDVVAYTYGGKTYAGRIAALEDDVVTVDESGVLLVNGTEQRGEILYPTYAEDGLLYPYRVSEGCVFVLGDYRTVAHDSRERGEIALEDVGGKVISLLRRRGL